MTKPHPKELSWFAFDMGNSAHALMISTVGFALYFRQYLFAHHPQPDFLWGMLTSIVLLISAIASPLLASWFSNKHSTGRGLIVVTLLCVFSTSLLFFRWNDNAAVIVALYVISAVTYYLALPLYNSFLPLLGSRSLQQTSAMGWSLGYLGGIGIVVLCLVLGLLDYPVRERPDLYRTIFLLSAIYNFLLSFPMLVLAWLSDRRIPDGYPYWSISKVFSILRRRPSVFRILISYWLVGEGATVVLYFTAIFLSAFAGMEAPEILKLTLILQGGAILSTWFFGKLADWISGKKAYLVVCVVWILIPPMLWSISRGFTYWVPLLFTSLVIGAYHSIVRGRIGELSQLVSDPLELGSLWGFLEVAGRMSQVLGPLLVGLAAYFGPLSDALLIASLFPVLGILIVRNTKWE